MMRVLVSVDILRGSGEDNHGRDIVTEEGILDRPDGLPVRDAVRVTEADVQEWGPSLLVGFEASDHAKVAIEGLPASGSLGD
jgi:hypothetical protein